MRRKIAAANWKMNGSKATNAELLNGFKANINPVGYDAIVFAPAVYLGQIEEAFAGTNFKYGAQVSHTAESGAFTGETSLAMVKDFGATHVLVGHSERRTLFGETDEVVAEKTEAALVQGVTPMLCIGETLEERESGITSDVVRRQLKVVLDKVGVEGFKKTVIAYEPVWAIGTGKTASPEQAQEVHADIRAFLADADAGMAESMQILYGGSVKAASAKELFSQKDIDGGLVGGASLIVEEFAGICAAAE